MKELSDRLIAGIESQLTHVIRNGDPDLSYPGCINLSFAYVEGESLLMALKEVALSSGRFVSLVCKKFAMLYEAEFSQAIVLFLHYFMFLTMNILFRFLLYYFLITLPTKILHDKQSDLSPA